MRDIHRRLKKIEQLFNMGDGKRCETRIILFDENCPEQEALPQNIEDWIIYKEREAKRSIGYSGPTVTLLMASDEVEARKVKGIEI
jgi:hypothetical protein